MVSNDEVIEEEIEGKYDTSPDKKQKHSDHPSSTTETRKSDGGSRNAKQENFQTFAEEQIEFTETYK